jgi:HNH endonuclease
MKKANPLPSLELVHNEFNYNPRSGELSYNMPRHAVVVGQVITGPTVKVPASGPQYAVERIIWYWMTGKDPGELLVDHQDGDHSNNRWSNLRLATPQQNMFNKEGTGQFAKGVVFKADANRSKPWSARIRIDGKKVPLGSFYTHDEAAEAYRIASEKVHGEFAAHKSRT